MKTVVAFTGNKVSVLCGDARGGKIRVEKLIRVSFSIGCVMNGVVTDTEAFCEGIRAAWKEHRLPKSGVILSVDGNHVTVKKTRLPQANRKRTVEMLVYDFQDTNAGGSDWVYGSMDLGPASLQGAALPPKAGEKEKAPPEERELLAATAEKAYVTELAEAFAQAGVKLASVVASRFSMIRLLPYLEEIKSGSCILESLDGEVLSTVLVENGKYLNFSSSRVFSDHGTPSFGGEVARTASQLLQFQSMLKSETRATDVYCLGFSKEDFDVSAEQIGLLGLNTSVLGESPSVIINGGSIRECFDHAGALALGRDEGNLYREIVSGDERNKKRDSFLLKLLPLLLLVAVFTVISSSMIAGNAAKERKVEELNAYLTNADNVAKEQAYNDYLTGSAKFNAMLAAATQMKEAIDSYPRAVSALDSIIIDAGVGIVDVSIQSFDAASGQLSFTATGQGAERLNEFVEALQNTGIFLNVTYSGYNLIEGTGEYNVNVSCVLSAAAGR